MSFLNADIFHTRLHGYSFEDFRYISKQSFVFHVRFSASHSAQTIAVFVYRASLVDLHRNLPRHFIFCLNQYFNAY
jgi:hypothetical protein